MSWLPSNYSLNSIKDQFTNLAGELLHEIRDEKDNSDGEQEAINAVLNYGGSTSTNSPQSIFESKIISDLKSQIQSLQNDKKDLISSLEQLDLDNQQNVEKLVTYKDTLQEDLQRSKNDFDSLKKDYDKLKDWSENDSENISVENEVMSLMKVDNDKLVMDNARLRLQIDENTISQDDYKKLEAELEQLQKNTLNSMEDKNAEAESLQNIVESCNKIIESKNGLISSLELANIDLKVKLDEQKLLSRNEIDTLNQQILNKSAEFDEFEADYNELLKTNDDLLSELNALKTNNLVTINETNEDNVLRLENDLDNANIKIRELEVIIDSEKSRPQSSEPFEILQKSFDEAHVEHADLQRALDKSRADCEQLEFKCNEQQAQIDNLMEDVKNRDALCAEEKCALVDLRLHSENDKTIEQLTTQISDLTRTRDDLITALNAKHAESLGYYQQIHQLQRHLQESSEAQAQREQTVERLRAHLVRVEETYTRELLGAEERADGMRTAVGAAEQREQDASRAHTSVSIRTNQQVEALRAQLLVVTQQRDEMRCVVDDGEDAVNRNAAALTNLQLVLQQFQKDKQKDVHNETDRIRRQIAVEKNTQAEMQKEINGLRQQLQESKEGLDAAARLTHQLEQANRSATDMSNELVKLRSKLNETERMYAETINQPDGKVDKSLIKNLIIGLISANNNLTKDQQQILKIISTVLDFTQQESDRVEVNKPLANSWIGSILSPAHVGQEQGSLSVAFVKFLENESQPMNLPSLLEDGKSTEEKNADAMGINEMVLPTFSDYAQRSSSSILKDVLKENPN